jgi:restriction endonuclease S subunit
MRETVKNNCQLLEEGEFSLPKGWEVKKLGEVGNIFKSGCKHYKTETWLKVALNTMTINPSPLYIF